MPRIRAIKPEFFDNEDVARLSSWARLAFQGLWTQADREGRLEDRPARLKARIFPYDDVDMPALLDELVRGNFILLYEVDEQRYIQVRTWQKHQRPHLKEPASTYPAPTQHLLSTYSAPVQHLPSTSLMQHVDSTRVVAEHLPSTDPAPTQHLPSPLDLDLDLGSGSGSGNGDGEPLPDPPSALSDLSIGQAHTVARSVVGLWNRDLPQPLRAVATEPASLPRVVKAVQSRGWALDVWSELFGKVRASAYLTGKVSGRDGEPFIADFWWVLENLDKIRVGRYDTRLQSRPETKADRNTQQTQSAVDAVIARRLAQ